MAVSARVVGDVTVLEVSGQFTGGDETDQLRNAILAEASQGNMRLVLDLSGCRWMNSSGISVLVEAYRNYAGRHAEIKLCGLQPRIINQLATVRLITLLGSYPTVDEAIAAFTPSRSEA